jgi:hypothetical protein
MMLREQTLVVALVAGRSPERNRLVKLMMHCTLNWLDRRASIMFGDETFEVPLKNIRMNLKTVVPDVYSKQSFVREGMFNN